MTPRASGRYGGAPLQQVGPYRLLEQLGSGSSAQVFLAQREGIERLFALKLLPLNVDPEGQARLEREARVASRLEHPGLVRVIDVGWLERRPYIVMEHVPGPTLQSWLEERGPVPWREAVGLITQVAAALQVAHEAGVFHRDLKPANIILDERDGRPRLADFGLAHDVQSDMGLTAAGDVLGTPYYMAPEQVSGDHVDARCDVYGLGVLLYEMLAGQRPYESDNVPDVYGLIQEGRPTPLRTLQPDLPSAVCNTCQRAFSKDRELRPEDAGALLAELERVVAGSGEEPAHTGSPRSVSRLAWSGAVGVASVVLLAVAVWTISGRASARTAVTELAAARAAVAGLEASVASEREGAGRRGAKRRDWAAEVAAAARELEGLTLAAGALSAELTVEARRGVEPLGTLAATIDGAVDALREAGEGAGLAANLLRNRGRYREAAELARKARDEGDRDPELLVVEFRAWQAMGRSDRSTPAVHALLREAPEGSTARVFAEAVSGRLGEREEVVRRVLEVSEATDGAPGYMWILVGRLLRNAARTAHGQERRDLLQRALDAADRAVEVDPCCPDAREVRAWALVGLRRLGHPRQGDVAQVIDDCRLSREINPAELNDWLLPGQILVLSGQPDLAAVELAEAVRRAGAAEGPGAAQSAAQAGVWLTNAYLEQGDEGAAERSLRQALSGPPGTKSAALELAGFLQRASPPLRARLLAMVELKLRPRLEGHRR